MNINCLLRFIEHAQWVWCIADFFLVGINGVVQCAFELRGL